MGPIFNSLWYDSPGDRPTAYQSQGGDSFTRPLSFIHTQPLLSLLLMLADSSFFLLAIYSVLMICTLATRGPVYYYFFFFFIFVSMFLCVYVFIPTGVSWPGYVCK